MAASKTVEMISNELKHACDLTLQIIECVEKIELDDVEKLNKQRLTLIDSIFLNDKTTIDVELAKQLFRLNAQVTQVLEQQIQFNTQEQQKFRKGNAAHTAYMQHSA